ncbi:ferritin-like domain-containing protein [Allorhizobium undicola]|uniref:ferritin-like domain-containing protein n=1 Tax=Allorhizobium undicola TaxID=78527 RepID=UPI00047FEF75|nr:ferritin-like protein [Allorhizobium undicola]
MPSYKIESLHDLRDMLQRAMQLEHATIPPYLTALYSIKPGTNADAVQILRVIAVEEMLHLTLAANILNAVGGKPDLTQPGFVPTYPSALPDGETDFLVSIQPFSREAVESFLKIERPARRPHHLIGKGLIRRKTEPGKQRLATPPGQPDLHFYSIGEFYTVISEGIRFLEEEARKAKTTIFTGDPALQITPEYYYSGGGNLIAVTDLDSALEAIDLIIEQGEGDGGGIYDDDEHELAHYYRFQELFLGRYYRKGDRPGHPSGPHLQVDWQGAYPMQPNVKLADIQQGSELYDATRAFNDRYGAFLALLTRAYNGEPQLLTDAAVPLMFEFRNIMQELIRNPLPGKPGRNGGPTYEIGTASQKTAPSPKEAVA